MTYTMVTAAWAVSSLNQAVNPTRSAEGSIVREFRETEVARSFKSNDQEIEIGAYRNAEVRIATGWI